MTNVQQKIQNVNGSDATCEKGSKNWKTYILPSGSLSMKLLSNQTQVKLTHPSTKMSFNVYQVDVAYSTPKSHNDHEQFVRSQITPLAATHSVSIHSDQELTAEDIDKLWKINAKRTLMIT